MFFSKAATRAIALATAWCSSAALVAADCQTQSSGCVFRMSESEGTLADAEFQCGLYDSACNPISDFPDCEPGLTLDSTLPYTVDVTQRGGAGSSLYVDFNYGAGSYNQDSDGASTDDCSSGLTGCSEVNIPFPC
ncbi:hypothetical protein GGR56DRAFT_677011 [Xylariaceae sp. FL0804]|nr:hypothetical protein GGR56DRAFT_677011 [Xylariaceae sp. FL0804]